MTTCYAKNGASDNFVYARFEDDGVFEAFTELSESFGYGTAYGESCGWDETTCNEAQRKVVDAGSKLITQAMLDNLKTDEDFGDFDSVDSNVFYDDCDGELDD